MKQGKDLNALMQELMRQAEAKKDYCADIRSLSLVRDETEGIKLKFEGSEDAPLPLGINEIAHRQMGTFLDIPAKYYDQCLELAPDLLIDNVNHWMQYKGNEKPVTRMVRTLDNKARAFLSNQYWPIDNDIIAATALPIILEEMEGVIVQSCDLTERKLYIKVVDPKIQADVKPGDTVQAGLIISNSEVGQGSFNVSPLIYRLVCKNGMIAETQLKKHHAGRRISANEDFSVYRDATMEQIDKAFLMKVADVVRSSINEVEFNRIVDKMRAATTDTMDYKLIPEVVEVTAKHNNITKEESKAIFGRLMEDGDLTKYGLASAITRHSQDVESYDRATELEAIGYEVLSMDTKKWNQINTEAAVAA